jgi:hypothetical protein
MTKYTPTPSTAPGTGRGCLPKLLLLAVSIAALLALAITQDWLPFDTPDASIKNMGGDPLYVTPTPPPDVPALPTLPPGEMAGQRYGRLQLQSEAFLTDVCTTLAAQPADYAAPAAEPLHAACTAVTDGAAPAYHTWSPALCAFPSLLDALVQRSERLPHYETYVARLCAE